MIPMARIGLFIMAALSFFHAGPGVSDQWAAPDLRHIRVGGEIGARIDATIDNLLTVDMDGDFVRPFRDRNQQSGYIGLGKTIDALVRLAAYSNDPRLMALKEKTVADTIATQEDDGYIGLLTPERRVFALWDIHEMAYLVYGLTMDYAFFASNTSRDAAQKLADYIIRRWAAEPAREPGGGEITVYMAVTGLESALLALHHATGNPNYLDFVSRFRKLPEWDGPIVIGRWGQIQGHAYAYLCRAIAQLRLNRIEPDLRLLQPTQRALDFLLNNDGLAITGACGQHECWHDSQEGAANLGETCATAYLIRWWDELLRINGDSLYGDLIERALYNALFAAQSPDGHKIRYYAPFEGPRLYFDADTYCCPCNFRRIIAELPQMVYYVNNGVAVNLYTPATATLTLDHGTQITLEQETRFPTDGNVRLRLKTAAPEEFPLKLRIPRWCNAAEVLVNGQKQDAPALAGTWCEIRRTWNDADSIELRLPMSLRLIAGRKAQAGRAAILYGPRVFCLDPEKNPALENQDPRLITIDPATLTGPFPDDSVRNGGLSCKIMAWKTTNWYPFSKHDWELTLTEFPDPAGTMTYFHVPNPLDPALGNDELASTK